MEDWKIHVTPHEQLVTVAGIRTHAPLSAVCVLILICHTDSEWLAFFSFSLLNYLLICFHLADLEVVPVWDC